MVTTGGLSFCPHPEEKFMSLSSKCPRSDCNSTQFEMKELKVKNSQYRLNAIQCTSCGAVVGVSEWLNLGQALAKIGDKLGVNVR
jgi:hypothetical protein